MNLFESIVLGIIQGITEFLPISSSGHLTLLQHLFGIKEGNLFFTVMLHFGTLISIFVVYFNDIIKIIKEFFVLIFSIFKGRKIKNLSKYQKLAILIIISSIPTAIIGFLFEDFFESLFSSILPIGFAFIITGFLLWVSEKKSFQNKNINNMSIFDAFLIGTAQGIAIIPGISRSGSTIVAGLLRGLNKPLVTEYSFLLALPVTFGATILKIIEISKSETTLLINFPLVLGVVISTIVGILSIKFLINLINKNKLHYFSYYLWILGTLVILSQLI
ncbi:MAG TPA: undecaprenyl-diphosphate phosphatase [Tissierellaceae bacterium]